PVGRAAGAVVEVRAADLTAGPGVIRVAVGVRDLTLPAARIPLVQADRRSVVEGTRLVDARADAAPARVTQRRARDQPLDTVRAGFGRHVVRVAIEGQVVPL